MIINGLISGVNPAVQRNFFCDPCLQGKHHRHPHKEEGSRKEEIAARVFANVCGPLSTESIGGARYFLLFKDEKSCFMNVYFLKHKSDVYDRLVEYTKMMDRSSQKVQIFRFDNDKEFINEEVKTF